MLHEKQKFDTGLAILPTGNTMYRCNRKTRVVLLEQEEDFPRLSVEELSQMERQHGGTVLQAAGGCSGSCAREEEMKSGHK